MAGGFVPGVLRFARERHNFLPDAQWIDKKIISAVKWVSDAGEKRYVVQAIDSGLVTFLESYLSKPEFQGDALELCASLLKVPAALAELRKAEFVPSVTLAAHSPVELGRWVTKHCRGSGLVADFVEAGLLRKLESVKSQTAGEPAQQREVATLIDVLTCIASEQPATQEEAEDATGELVSCRGSAASGPRAQSQNRGRTRNADEQVRIYRLYAAINISSLQRLFRA